MATAQKVVVKIIVYNGTWSLKKVRLKISANLAT